LQAFSLNVLLRVLPKHSLFSSKIIDADACLFGLQPLFFANIQLSPDSREQTGKRQRVIRHATDSYLVLYHQTIKKGL